MIIKITSIARPWPKKELGTHKYSKRKLIYQRDPKGYWKAFSESFRLQVKLWMNTNGVEMIARGVPLALGTLIFIPRPKTVSIKKRPFPVVSGKDSGDFDNYKYGIMNLLKGLLFHDDNQVVFDLEGGLFYADKLEPSVYIRIREMTSPPEWYYSDMNYF